MSNERNEGVYHILNSWAIEELEAKLNPVTKFLGLEASIKKFEEEQEAKEPCIYSPEFLRKT